MTTGSDTPPKYDLKIVESVVLYTAIDLHPEHLPVDRLLMRIVGNPGDDREVETAALAIRSLQEFGPLKIRDEEIAEPAPAALHYTLLNEL